MESNKAPNPIIDKVSNAIASIRADDDMLALAKAHDSLEPLAIEKLTPAEARTQPTIADAVAKLLSDQGRATDPQTLVPGVTSHDIEIDGATGRLPARVFTPEGVGPFPLILYFHGGGWVIADRTVYDAGARGLAKEAHAVVVSVDYRQAPEHKFPAAWDDALASYIWLQNHAAELQGNAQVIALAGESAGGNLAMATAVAIRDAGLRPPVHVVSVYPVTQTSLNTESYLENAIAKPLNRAMVEWFVEHLLNHPDEKKDPRLSLIDADLRGLPSVTIINAQIDPLRSDGAKLEAALRAQGVEVVHKVYDGVTHEFFGAAAVVQKARDAQAYAGQQLNLAFQSAPTLTVSVQPSHLDER